jgi:hypothetical protein
VSEPSSTVPCEPMAWYSEHETGGGKVQLTIYEKPKSLEMTYEGSVIRWIPLYAQPSVDVTTNGSRLRHALRQFIEASKREEPKYGDCLALAEWTLATVDNSDSNRSAK